jgi:hypothetical protein
MANDWMLDVLADLKAFAESNGLGATERQLDQTMVTVRDEIEAHRGFAQGTVQNVSHVGELHRSASGCRNS